MNPALNDAMHGVLDSIEALGACRAVVLKGAGGNFSSGMDMHEFLLAPAADGPIAQKRVRDSAHGWWRRWRWIDQPTIALVEGCCVGGAFAPLFACDLAVVAEDAQFSLPEIDLGILSVANITKIVADLMGPRKAAYYLMSGQAFSGRQAEAFGLVTEAMPSAALEARVTEIAALMASKDVHAMKATKETLKHVLELSFAEAEDYLDVRQLALNGLQGTTPAARAQAFLDTRRKGAGR